MTTDFHFLHGTWNVVNRRPVKLLVDCDEWEEFPATLECRSLLDGAANVDEMTFPTKGFKGLTLRLYDPERREWTIYWVNSRTGLLQAPVVGGFAGGECELFGDDVHEGVPVRARYKWSRITPTSARWEQAYSVDGEQTWETNWIMDCTRTG
jgi:hypothetical protein